MNPKSAGMAFAVAVVIAIAAGAFYFFVDDYSSTTSNRLEEPYKRTENAPPSAIPDENSHPDLKNSGNAASANP
jgi:hypothetical protein